MFLAQIIAGFQICNFKQSGIGESCHDLSEFLTKGSVEHRYCAPEFILRCGSYTKSSILATMANFKPVHFSNSTNIGLQLSPGQTCQKEFLSL